MLVRIAHGARVSLAVGIVTVALAIAIGAPVGLIFSIDRMMRQGSWLDYGMFLQNIMVAARARGLHTCPQAAFTEFHRVIAEELAFRPEQMLVCGMALGYADPVAVENTLLTERAAVSEFARFVGEW